MFSYVIVLGPAAETLGLVAFFVGSYSNGGSTIRSRLPVGEKEKLTMLLLETSLVSLCPPHYLFPQEAIGRYAEFPYDPSL